MTKAIGIGAGGHGRCVLEILRTTGGFDVVGFIDADPNLRNRRILGLPVLGDDTLLDELHRQGIRHAFIGVGTAGDTRPRRRLFELTLSLGFRMISAIHPTAILAPSAKIGNAVTVMAGAIVTTAAQVGDNVIINSGAIVEHDCIVGSHAHIASGARLAGNVHVGEGTHIGLGACVKQGVRIGRNSIVGAGTVVLEDIPDDVTAVGVPSRILAKDRP